MDHFVRRSYHKTNKPHLPLRLKYDTKESMVKIIRNSHSIVDAS